MEESDRARYLAHSNNVLGKDELLRDHLQLVASRAATFASVFGAGDEAHLAGLLHDLGKYGELFQRRLAGLEKGIDHWSPGAFVALTRFRRISAALAVQGHHVGLQVATEDALRALDLDRVQLLAPHRRLSDSDIQRLLQRARADGVEPVGSLTSEPHYGSPRRTDYAAAMLDVRMLFSALVDADFIETETHFKGGSIRPEGASLEASRALSELDEYTHKLGPTSRASSLVNAMRADLLAECNASAGRPPGLFTLTAPTGTGKTIAMLAFALRHAMQHGLRRVVIVIPYLSVIEQTASVYREVFTRWQGDAIERYLLENHSLAGTRSGEEGSDGSEGRSRTRLLAENWDAPVVVTTSVQMLESLFANRPAACRKLHRLARSVVLFDEVQTLPRSLAVPTLATLARLSERYGSTIVFATATQPAFKDLDAQVRPLCTAGWNPTEIVPPELDLARRARRVTVQWPSDCRQETPWTTLAQELLAERLVLCIVNLKRHALRVFESVSASAPEGTFHLSTSMCPRHRQAVLELVRERLLVGSRDGRTPCRLISTQCIEAGVDLDFPVVYRAFGPLEAIVQAAGRCNRNGRDREGTVRVFVPPAEGGKRYPDAAYGQAADILAAMLAKQGASGFDPHEPHVVEQYYRAVFQLLDPSRISGISGAIIDRDFVKTAEAYRLIDRDTVNVLVPYEAAAYENLRKEVESDHLSGGWMRRARPHVVSLFRPRPSDGVHPYLNPLPVTGNQKSEEWFIYTERGHYRPDVGLVPPGADAVWIA